MSGDSILSGWDLYFGPDTDLSPDDPRISLIQAFGEVIPELDILSQVSVFLLIIIVLNEVVCISY